MEIIVGGLVIKDNKFLLVQEAKAKCYGKWNIPAGHLELGETIFEGAKREIYEETGCTVELKDILELSDNFTEDKYWIGIIFATELINENISFDKNELLAVKWFTYEEIINMKENLRVPEAIINCINAYYNNKTVSQEFIKIRR